MFVTIVSTGESFKNDPSDSSASAIIYSPLPSLALVFKFFSFPPITIVGSNPPSSNIIDVIDVVVVLP